MPATLSSLVGCRDPVVGSWLLMLKGIMDKKLPSILDYDTMSWKEFWRWLCLHVPEKDGPLWIIIGGWFWLGVVGLLVIAFLFVRSLVS